MAKFGIINEEYDLLPVTAKGKIERGNVEMSQCVMCNNLFVGSSDCCSKKCAEDWAEKFFDIDNLKI